MDETGSSHPQVYDCFTNVDVRVGRIRTVKPFERARTPSYRVVVDFGPEIGDRESSVQAATDYTIEELEGSWVVGVVNLPPRNIAGFSSQALILGVPRAEGGLSLLRPDGTPTLGGRLY